MLDSAEAMIETSTDVSGRADPVMIDARMLDSSERTEDATAEITEDPPVARTELAAEAILDSTDAREEATITTGVDMDGTEVSDVK